MMKDEEMEKKEQNTCKVHQAQGRGKEPELYSKENRQSPEQEQRDKEEKEDVSDGIDRRSRSELPVRGCRANWQW